MVYDPGDYWSHGGPTWKRPDPPGKRAPKTISPVSRCPMCAMTELRAGKLVCKANGRTITPDMGCNECAHVPLPKADDD